MDGASKVDVAVRLLMEPLAAELRRRPQPVLILLDALDEADPPEEQRPGYSGCIKACGNQMWSLLVQQLMRSLPPCVRFIVTTRPDALGNKVEPALRQLVPSMRYLEPQDLIKREVAPVMVFHMLVAEFQLRGMRLLAAILTNVYAAYLAVFLSRSPLGDGVMAVIGVLLAAEEPPSTFLLQQMGMREAQLRQLPGWGTLFYESEHHVLLLHKSLNDWLLLADGHDFRPDLEEGHKRLGMACLMGVGRPSRGPLPEYTTKYGVSHLCRAQAQHPQECGELLDAVLSDWGFLAKVFIAGHGGALLSALNSLQATDCSPYTRDTRMWLGRCVVELEARPDR